MKSLVPFPVVLATMNGNLTWLQQLGYAFATQQADVFAAVQRLRRLAQANDKLQSSPQQVVSTQQVTVEPPAGSTQAPTQQDVIVIEPAQSDTVYVPSYDPANGVRLVVALPIISAVLPGPAARLLFRHRAGHRAGIRRRRRGRGRPMGLGKSRVGRRLRERQRQPVQQHQHEPAADQFNPLGRGRREGRPGNFPRAPGGPAGLPGRSQVSVPGNAVRPPTRPGGPGGVGGVGGAGRRAAQAASVVWAASVVLGGRAVPAVWRRRRCGRPGGPGGVGGVGGAGRPGAGGVGGVGGAGRPGGAGGVGGVGGAGRPGGAGGVGGAVGRVAQAVSAGLVGPAASRVLVARVAWRCRPAGRRATPGRRVRRHEQRPPGRSIRPAGRAEPVHGSAASRRRRRSRWWRRARGGGGEARAAAAVAPRWRWTWRRWTALGDH